MEQRWPKMGGGSREKMMEMLGAVLGVIFRSVRLSVAVFRRPAIEQMTCF